MRTESELGHHKSASNAASGFPHQPHDLPPENQGDAKWERAETLRIDLGKIVQPHRSLHLVLGLLVVSCLVLAAVIWWRLLT